MLKRASSICLLRWPLSLSRDGGDWRCGEMMDNMLSEASGKDTHPADGHHVVAYQHSSHKLGLDALSQQDLLEVRQAGLVDEHRLMPWNLEGKWEESAGQTRGCLDCLNALVDTYWWENNISIPFRSLCRTMHVQGFTLKGCFHIKKLKGAKFLCAHFKSAFQVF